LKDEAFADSCRAEISDLIHRGRKTLRHIDKRITDC